MLQGSLNRSTRIPFIPLTIENPWARKYFQKTGYRVPVFFHGWIHCVFTGKENELFCLFIKSFLQF
jgi:hypothetical protein